MMTEEETEHAAFIHVAVMSMPAMVVALTCRGSKLIPVFTEISFIKRTSGKSLKYPQQNSLVGQPVQET